MTPGESPEGVRVLIIDDGRLSRECLAAQLELNGIDVDCAWDLPSLFSATDGATPDVILLNIRTEDSATLLQVSLDMDAGVRVVIFGLSATRELEIVTCAEAGVAGLHLRSESLEHLMTLVMANRCARLKSRQFCCARCIPLQDNRIRIPRRAY